MSNIRDKQYLFIIGAPRSGTTWLQLMIGAHPQVCTSVELTIYDRYTGPWIETWKREMREKETRPGLPLFWTDEDFYEFLRLFLDNIYERMLITKPDATHILDKRPSYSEYVADIHTLLPNARFIHLLRDGRDVAASMMAAARDLWFMTDTMPKAASKWKEKVQQAQRAKEFEGQYLEVRYEELLTNGLETLKSLFDFCRLPVDESLVKAIFEEHSFEKLQVTRKAASEEYKMPEKFYRKGKSGSWREDLSPAQMQRFDEMAGDLLRELGYAQEGWLGEHE